MTTSPKTITDEIFNLIDQYGNESYGENVTQLQHAIQAADLAAQETDDEEVIIAAFLHDIGHMCGDAAEGERMGKFGVVSHEKLGSDFLRKRGFSEKVAQLIEGHVGAKRYLTFKYPDYYEKLSHASKQTLRYQGGIMNPEEAIDFEANSWFDLFLRMRHWDDEAKLPDIEIKGLEKYREMIERHLST